MELWSLLETYKNKSEIANSFQKWVEIIYIVDSSIGTEGRIINVAQAKVERHAEEQSEDLVIRKRPSLK